MNKLTIILLVACVLIGCHGTKVNPQLVAEVDEVHAYLRAHRCLPAYPDIDSLAMLLKQEGLKGEAGKALYISGAGKNIVGEDEDAMQALKQAEELLTDEPSVEPYYLGMTYYKMGRISENEMLYEVAQHYYRQALPYLQEDGQPLYLASVYRELARMTTDTAEQRDYFRQALEVAEDLDRATYLDIRYAMLSRLAPNDPERMAISEYLCDSAGQKRYAQDIARAALRQGDYARAEKYLRILNEDSTTRAWSQKRQAYIHSLYLHQTGSDRQAFLEMQQLYEQLAAQQEEDGRVRSYAIAQRYDNAAEREKNLRLKVHQQRLYAMLAIAIAAMLMIVAIGWVMRTRRRSKQQIQDAITQAEITRLRTELSLRQQSIRKVLQQRLELSKSLQESTIRHKKEGELPDWAKQFVETNIFQTEEQWIAFRQDFNEAYEGLLDRMKAEHPALTAVDQQVIALILLEMDISDICLLLNQTKRTIWSRRLRIKEHLGLNEEEQLDNWLKRQI